MDTSEEWTAAHDLALIYSGLASLDRELTDGEVEAIRKMLLDWMPLSAKRTPQEIVQEAARALKRSEKDIRRAIHRLGRQFGPDEQRSTLQGLLRIAEADGVLLESERDLIHSIANAWELKQLSEEWGIDPSAVEGHRGEHWKMIHGIAFLFVQGTNGKPSSEGIDVIQNRLQEWRPKQTDEEVSDVLRRALQAYANQSEESLPPDSVEELGQALPEIQQLLVLDDLHTIAQADGPLTHSERQLILSVADAWEINVRLEVDE